MAMTMSAAVNLARRRLGPAARRWAGPSLGQAVRVNHRSRVDTVADRGGGCHAAPAAGRTFSSTAALRFQRAGDGDASPEAQLSNGLQVRSHASCVRAADSTRTAILWVDRLSYRRGHRHPDYSQDPPADPPASHFASATTGRKAPTPPPPPTPYHIRYA